MSELIRVVDGTPQRVTKRQIRQAFPNVSFRANYPDEVLARFNVFRATDAGPPDYDTETQTLSRGYTETSPGVWEVSYTVSDIPASEREAAAEAAADELITASGRDKALALATVDLVEAAVAGQLNGRTTQQIRQA